MNQHFLQKILISTPQQSNITFTPELITIIITALGVIISAVSLSSQIIRAECEKEKNKIASLRSSLIELKGKLQIIVSLIENNLTVNALVFIVLKQLNSDLSNKETKNEIVFFLKDEGKLQFLRASIEADLYNSKIREEIVKELNDARKLPNRYQPDMPLTSAIIYDTLFIIDYIISNIFLSSAVFPILYPKESSNEAFCNSLNHLNESDLSDSSLIKEKIAIELLEQTKQVRNNQMLPLVRTAFETLDILFDILLSLRFKEMNKLKNWDQNPSSYNQDVIIRLAENWRIFIEDGLEEKILNQKRVKALKLNLKYKQVCTGIRHILDTTGFYDRETIYHIVQSNPQLNVAVQ